MADRRPIWVVAAPGTDQPHDVLGEQGRKHLQARPNSQSQQALAGGAGQLGNRDGDLLRQLQLGTVDGGVVGIVRHGGPLLVELLIRKSTVRGQTAAPGAAHRSRVQAGRWAPARQRVGG
jgi:hypothetical protein